MLKLLGFFTEFNDLPTGSSLAASVRPSGAPDEPEIVAYLDAGHMVLPLMEGTPDPLTGDFHERASGGPSHLTDGTWVWRLDLPYYVEAYHVELPQEFLDHVRSRHYEIGQVRAADFKPEYEEILPLFGWSAQWDGNGEFL